MSAIHPLSHAPVVKVDAQLKPPPKPPAQKIETANPPKPPTATGVNKTV